MLNVPANSSAYLNHLPEELLRPTVSKAKITICTHEYRPKHCKLKELSLFDKIKGFPKMCTSQGWQTAEKQQYPMAGAPTSAAQELFLACHWEESYFSLFPLSFASILFLLFFLLFPGSPLKFVPQTSHPMSFL